MRILPIQVGGPVDQIEHGEHEGEEDARHHVDSLGPGGEFGEPLLAPIPLGRWCVHIAGMRLLVHVVRTVFVVVGLHVEG